MSDDRAPSSIVRILLATLAMVPILTLLSFGQEKPQKQRVPLLEDWSTHHLIFSNPGTFEQASKTNSFLNWYKVQMDPRYQYFQLMRNSARMRGAGGASVAPTSDFATSRNPDLLSPDLSTNSKSTKMKPQGDWSTYLGGASGAGIDATMYPAKYTFDINAPPDCQNDFVVVPVNQAPASEVTATGSVVIHSEPNTGDTVTIGSTVYDFQTTTNNCVGSEKCVQQASNTSTEAGNLASAIAGACFDNGSCGADPAVTVSSVSGNRVNLLAITLGSNGNVAMATSDKNNIHLNNASQSSSSLSGGADGQASIVAFNQLYSGGQVAASQIGSVASNGAASGSTVTVGGQVLTASDPTAETATLTVGSLPATGSSIKLGSLTYHFVNSNTISTPSSGCNIRAYSGAGGDSSTTVALHLDEALTNGGSASSTTWRCASGAAPNTQLSVTSFANPTISLEAATPGSTGFTESPSGTPHLTFSSTPGTNGTTSGTGFAYWSGAAPVSASQLALNLATAINDNTTLQSSSGVSAIALGSVITLTARTAGLGGNSIGLAESVGGFGWGGTTLVGGTAAGPCTGPSVMWAYNASTASTPSGILGSPVLSSDGTKVAFVESGSIGPGMILHVLRWEAVPGGGNLNATPAVPTPATNSSDWATCLSGSTSCMFNLQLGIAGNNNSPPFYDYSSDVLYVGDNWGHLFKVSNVFNGTPTNVTTSPWGTFGIAVSQFNALTGPVYDFGSGDNLVADNQGNLFAVAPDGTINSVSGFGSITDPPMVDSTTGKVWVFSGGNGSASEVTQFTISGLSDGVQINVGTDTSSGSQLHSGTVDNNYFNDVGSGHLYVCGKGATAAPALYQINFAADGTMGNVTGGPLSLATTKAAQECSPVSEFYNPNEGTGIDWIFVGIPANCAFGGSATGCIMAFDITNAFPAGAFATGAESGGTSGIIGDNVSTSGQASSMYFTTLGSPGAGGCTIEPPHDSTNCLVKRTQAGLQ